jgi:hypothetical protein
MRPRLVQACEPGKCQTFMVGGAPSPGGYTFRMCSRCGETWVTDRIDLGMPAQVVIGPPRNSMELEEVYA